MIRVLIADDIRLQREAFRMVLEREPDMRVIGEAADGRVAIRMVENLSPDVVVLDLTLLAMDALVAARRIRSLDKGTRILLTTIDENDCDIQDALRSGVTGIVSKMDGFGELVTAIRDVAGGNSYFSPKLRAGWRTFRPLSDLPHSVQPTA